MEATNKKKKTTNNDQFTKLVDEMEKNPDIARGFPSVGKNKEIVNQFWDELTNVLNSLGPPVKKCVDWRKVWNDYKRHIKNKIANNKAEITATGGGPNVSYQFSLSPLEQQVDALINLSSSGAPSGRSYGPKNISINEEVFTDIMHSSLLQLCESENEENMPNLVNIPQLNTPRSKPRTNPGLPEIEKQRMQLLEQQTKNQKEILDTLKNIDKNTNNQQYYTKKLFQLKQRKLQLQEEQFNKQQQNQD